MRFAPGTACGSRRMANVWDWTIRSVRRARVSSESSSRSTPMPGKRCSGTKYPGAAPSRGNRARRSRNRSLMALFISVIRIEPEGCARPRESGIFSPMNRTLIARVSTGLVFLAGAWFAYTQQAKQAPQLKLNQVKPDLYEIEGDGGNVAVYITNEGVILIDDKFDQDHDQIVANVKKVTSQPIKYIISTHYHADHSGGNARFLPTAEIISTANARKNIVNHVQSNAPPGVLPARVV